MNEIGTEVTMACVLYRDRTTKWEATTDLNFIPGSYEEKVFIHNRKYPQHPLCIRRVYWAVEVEPVKREDGERILRLTFARIEPSLATRDRLYEVDVEKMVDAVDGEVETRFEMTRSQGLINPGAYDIFDPVDQAFGQEWMAKCYEENKGKRALLIQEQLLIDDPEDWDEFYYSYFGAREVMRSRCKAMEVVQILEVVGEEGKRRYRPFPRYAKY